MVGWRALEGCFPVCRFGKASQALRPHPRPHYGQPCTAIIGHLPVFTASDYSCAMSLTIRCAAACTRRRPLSMTTSIPDPSLVIYEKFCGAEGVSELLRLGECGMNADCLPKPCMAHNALRLIRENTSGQRLLHTKSL